MKKLIALLTIAGFMTFGISNSVLAQQEENVPQTEQVAAEATEQVAEEAAPVEEVVETATIEEVEEEPTFHEVLKKQYIDGGWGFMTLVLVCLILGLALCIERIIYLTLSTSNTKKLLAELEVGKAYSIVVACDLETTDYYVFLDGNYIPESHSEFNVEFAQLSAFRFDIFGEGIQVTLDDLCIDGCLIKRIATATSTPAPTQAPTTAPTQAPTAAPTQAPAEEGGCGSSAAVVQIMLILGTALIIKKRK